jgi:hypothetical protein
LHLKDRAESNVNACNGAKPGNRSLTAGRPVALGFRRDGYVLHTLPVWIATTIPPSGGAPCSPVDGISVCRICWRMRLGGMRRGDVRETSMKRVMVAVIAATFLTGSMAAPALAQAPQKTEAKPKAAGEAKPARKMSPGLLAARERQKKCGAEWREAKAGGKVEKGMKWPKYWSACNKRLKEAGA